jgi:rhodanese-related sulfurtransferase
MTQHDFILLAALLAGLAWFLLLRGRQGPPLTRQQLKELVEDGAQIVDVRTPAEFAQGHPKGARNIPLAVLKERMGELDPAKPVLTCCASGMRSASARSRLMRAGFKAVHNAGPWTNLKV